MKRYVFRDHSFVKGDPQKVGETLDALQRENGRRLTPRIVVDAARPAESPLHESFEWDDARAAELHREQQARQMISCVRVVIDDGPESKLQRAFVNVVETIDEEEQHSYVPMARVLADAELFRQVCETAARDLHAWESRYEQFEELASIGRDARQRVQQLPLTPAVNA